METTTTAAAAPDRPPRMVVTRQTHRVTYQIAPLGTRETHKINRKNTDKDLDMMTWAQTYSALRY